MMKRLWLTATLLALSAVGISPSAFAQAWVSDSSVGEGQGIKAGLFVLHPGISGELGYDSNYYQRAGSIVDDVNFGPVVPFLRFRVTPTISVKTLDTRQESADSSSDVVFGLRANMAYNEFVAFESQFNSEAAGLRRLMGGADASLSLFPKRHWSGQFDASYQYIAEPSNQPGLDANFDRSLIGLNMALKWVPGRGRFQWTVLQTGTTLTIFRRQTADVLDRNQLNLTSFGQWDFLPKTSVVYDGSFGTVNNQSDTASNGVKLKGRVGLSGLLTKRVSLTVKGGWGAGFYSQGIKPQDYASFIGNAELKWFIASGQSASVDGSSGGSIGVSALSLGYSRDFADSYLGSFFRKDREYVQLSYSAGGVFVARAGAGIAQVAYPDFVTAGTTNVQSGFQEVRIDSTIFGEYRPLSSFGISLSLNYDQNLSRVIEASSFDDDLSFRRFRSFLALRWFM